MRTRSTAGQATIEYLAALALIAALFVFAGPAVGTPPIAKDVVHGIRRGICLVAHDVCSSAEAKAEKLPPCPLSSDLTGHEVSAEVFSIQVGHRWTLTVTPNSDGTVSVVRTATGNAGVDGGVEADASLGPISAEAGAEASAGLHVQVARGWDFPNQKAAAAFLKHATLNTFDEKDFPASWHSLEGGLDLAAQVGVSANAGGETGQLDLATLSASGTTALGGKLRRDGTVTLYGRVAGAADLDWPILSTPNGEQHQATVEYTFNRDGPREIAFRTQSSTNGRDDLTETVATLDLRDPSNRAFAASLLNTALPWPPSVVAHIPEVLKRIETNGTVETTTSSYDDNTRGISAHVKGDLGFGFSGKLIHVHKTLLSATVRTNGSGERDRTDCVGDQS